MKACVLTNYGLPDYFELRDESKPVPQDDEVLVKVRAVSINSWDWEILKGKPLINRMLAGWRKPTKIKILGCDISGLIETVGKNVTQFKPGDEVFGDISRCGWGGLAEYVCVPANKNALALKPSSLTFEQAAAIPQAGVLALQGLRQGKIEQARKVLINGASGGVGSFAVPMAKSYGAEVTGVCRTSKMEFVRSLGADRVIDYTQEDFTRKGQQYDLILDVQGHHSVSDYRHALTRNGRYVMVGGASGLIFQVMFLGSLISVTNRKKMGLLLHKPDANDLDILKRFVEEGKVTPSIDKCFSLNDVAKAFTYYDEGLVQGKVVIFVSQADR
ncbi:MAG: NAD(P)-dependent alcohol dehydrogenase [Gammaproteobacteria bacterium]|nr:NAD(P)-dependent alcohol dehydrogenase [Gammaproteobacteria bacterium]